MAWLEDVSGLEWCLCGVGTQKKARTSGAVGSASKPEVPGSSTARRVHHYDECGDPRRAGDDLRACPGHSGDQATAGRGPGDDGKQRGSVWCLDDELQEKRGH